jgi:hypothetical protein
LSGLPGILGKLSSIGAFAFHDDMVDACILRTHNQIQKALANTERKTVEAEQTKPLVTVDLEKHRKST